MLIGGQHALNCGRSGPEARNNHIAELARRIGQSRQNFGKKLKRETLTLEELKSIADALGVVFEQSFTMPDGKQLKIDEKRKT